MPFSRLLFRQLLIAWSGFNPHPDHVVAFLDKMLYDDYRCRGGFERAENLTKNPNQPQNSEHGQLKRERICSKDDATDASRGWNCDTRLTSFHFWTRLCPWRFPPFAFRHREWFAVNHKTSSLVAVAFHLKLKQVVALLTTWTKIIPKHGRRTHVGCLWFDSTFKTTDDSHWRPPCWTDLQQA